MKPRSLVEGAATGNAYARILLTASLRRQEASDRADLLETRVLAKRCMWLDPDAQTRQRTPSREEAARRRDAEFKDRVEPGSYVRHEG